MNWVVIILINWSTIQLQKVKKVIIVVQNPEHLFYNHIKEKLQFKPVNIWYFCLASALIYNFCHLGAAEQAVQRW